MAFQYINQQTIGTLYIDDTGHVSVNGSPKPQATVIEGTDGALRVQIDGQTIDIGWDEGTVPLADVAPAPVSVIDPATQLLLTVLEKRLPGITMEFQRNADPPAWDSNTIYVPGDPVKHGGRYYRALPDVATGYPPDDVYDLATQTGGWAPL